MRTLWLLALVVLVGCPGPADEVDAGLDAGTADAGTADAGIDWYPYVAPPATTPPGVLAGETWRTHLRDDVLPYWLQADAKGTPEGNFPTWRGMDGALASNSDRRPRMIARQTYAYSMAYLMTGDEALLRLAHHGERWLSAHAVDPRGGCHSLLDQAGQPKGSDPKYAQDLAYCALGFSAWFYVTRDPEAEAHLLALRDLLFDPQQYWDEANHRIKDGRTAALDADVDTDGDNGWELVAQLDAINAFLLLSQPVLSDEARRAQFLGDLRVLGQTLIDHFWQDGIFWGVSTKKGVFGSKHADWGHTLKSYWMLLQIDKRLADHPFHDFLTQHLGPTIDRAWDDGVGRWSKRPLDATSAEGGSDWWIYAEADQLLATLALRGGPDDARREPALGHFLTDYVDGTLPARELIPSIKRNGTRAYPWPVGDTAKCNEWKSGFHSTEHALVLSLVGDWRTGAQPVLHFAVPAAESTSFNATPYVFDGTVVQRAATAAVDLDGLALTPVAVTFERLH